MPILKRAGGSWRYEVMVVMVVSSYFKGRGGGNPTPLCLAPPAGGKTFWKSAPCGGAIKTSNFTKKGLLVYILTKDLNSLKNKFLVYFLSKSLKFLSKVLFIVFPK